VEHNKHRLLEHEDIAPFVEIIQFLSLNWKFLGLTTLILSAIALAYCLLTTPKQYQKQLTVSVTSPSVPLSVTSPSVPLAVPSSSAIALDVNKAGAMAVEFLKSSQLDQISVTSRYDVDTQKIELNLQSPDAKALNTADSQVISQLKTKFQQPLSQTLKTSLIATEVQLKKQQLVLAQLEQLIAQTPPINGATQEALSIQRAQSLANVTALKFDQNYIEQSLKNLADFTEKFMSVQIVNASDVQQTRSSGQMFVIAVITSFMLAVLAVIIRDQLVRLKYELSKKKIDGGTDV
jgi:hypothetical protein